MVIQVRVDGRIVLVTANEEQADSLAEDYAIDGHLVVVETFRTIRPVILK